MKDRIKLSGSAMRGELVSESIERAIDGITARAMAGKASLAETIFAEALVSSLLAKAEVSR